MKTITALAMGAAALLAPGGLAAQVSVGLGVGGAQVAQSAPALDAARPSLHARVTGQVGRGIALVVEGQAHGLIDDDPEPADISTFPIHRPEVLRTDVVLLGVQVGVGGGLYVRTGAGVGRHVFPAYVGLSAFERDGWGIAAGGSAGYRLRLGGRLSVALEASALWSGGQEFSEDRTMFGIQVVPMLRL